MYCMSAYTICCGSGCGGYSTHCDICSVDADDKEDQELQQALWLSSQQAQPYDADPQGFHNGGDAEPGVVLTAFLGRVSMSG